MFKRILLKLSGESLAGANKQGIDTERLNQYAEQVKAIAQKGVQVMGQVKTQTAAEVVRRPLDVGRFAQQGQQIAGQGGQQQQAGAQGEQRKRPETGAPPRSGRNRKRHGVLI